MIYLIFEVLYCQEGLRKYTKHHDWCDIMWWCCDVERTLMTSWIIKRGLTILRAHQWLSVQGEEADKDICLCLAHPASLVIKGSGQNKAKLNQNMAIFAHIFFSRKYLSNEEIMIWFCIGCGTFDILFFFFFIPSFPTVPLPSLRLHWYWILEIVDVWN